MANDNDKAKDLIKFGTDIAGSIAGGALAFLAVEPVGAAVGSATGIVMAQSLKMVTDFAYRNLSQREKVRVGAGIAFALDKIDRHLKEGTLPRDDGFFDCDESGRSSSDEILEGVLFKCKNEHEEKKTKFLGYIYANTAFRSDISPSNANWLLQVAQDLTYRQLSIPSPIYVSIGE